MKKYRIMSVNPYWFIGLRIGDIVELTNKWTDDYLYGLFKLPKHLHGNGHCGYSNEYKKPNYWYLPFSRLEEVK